jgi:hypothetical protein
MPLPAGVTGYMFIDKDPFVDIWRRAKELTGMTNAQIHANGGPTTGTMNKWDLGETRRPQHLTSHASMNAMGFREEWVNRAGKRLRGDYPYSAKRR